MKKTKERGITLIALVVTIVVLLILAGISISMLTGDNGVITQSKNAKEATEQAKVEELVSVAIGSVIAKNNGSTAGITPKMIADQINEDEKRTDVYAENETTFPTNIVFPKENRKAEANINSVNLPKDDEPIYSADVNEADIAPVDLFDYEIINDGETGSLTISKLPTKTVRITRIKPEFCNGNGYNPDTKQEDYTNTYYEIKYNGTEIYDELVIPYQVDGKYVPNGIEGEYYKVTEACIYVPGNDKGSSELPAVKKIVFPDTITKIIGEVTLESKGNNTIEEIVLSKNIKTINEREFRDCSALKSITIPEGVTSIGEYAFYYCTNLTEVIIPDSVINIGKNAFYNTPFYENQPDGDIYLGKVYYTYKGSMPAETEIRIKEGTKRIEAYALTWKDNLKSIVIPDSVISIESNVFNGCDSLSKIEVSKGNKKYDSRNNCNAIIETSTNKLIRGCNTTVIPDEITSIEENAFYACKDITSLKIPDSVISIGKNAFSGCNNITKIVIPNGVQNIESDTFYGCYRLTSITIPASITNIDESAFERCSSLTTVNYTGTEEEWNKISIGSSNECLTNATINYNYTN